MRITAAPRTGPRVLRRPRHDFNLVTRPWQIQPFMIAPVLPGETLRNLLMQARCVTDPIANPLVGWHKEYYFFYVQFDDLVDELEDELKAMIIDPDATVTNVQPTSAQRWSYTNVNTVRYVTNALTAVVEHYFRDEGEDVWSAPRNIDSIPIAAINRDGIWQSATPLAAMPSVTIDQTPAADIDLENIDRLQRQWEALTQMALTKMSFEDYLRSAGVTGQASTDPKKPELIRYVKDWQYPSNTIEPTTGAPSSAVSWSIAERADKDRYFAQPGWIFGVTIARPKVYFGNQEGNAAALMNNAFSWMPPLLREDHFTTLKEYAQDTGLVDASDDGYVIDIRDLLTYGDQFLNYDPAATTNGGPRVALPNAAMDNYKYASSTDADNLFTSASSKRIREDGTVQLTIASYEMDHTP